MSDKSFIVPHDFSEVADSALNHAIITAKVVGAKIYILHVVSKNKDISQAESKLKEIVEAHKSSKIELIPKVRVDRKSTRLNSSHVRISYAVFCLKKKKKKKK